MSECKEACTTFRIHPWLLLLNLKQIKFRVNCLANPCDLAIGIWLSCQSDSSQQHFFCSQMPIPIICYKVFFELALLINSTSNTLGVSAKNTSLEDDCYAVTLPFQPKTFTCFVLIDCVYRQHFTTAYILLSTTYVYNLSLMETGLHCQLKTSVLLVPTCHGLLQ